MIEKGSHDPYTPKFTNLQEWTVARQTGKIEQHRNRWRIALPKGVYVYCGRDGRAFYSQQEAQFWLGQIQGEIARGIFDIKYYRKGQVSLRTFSSFAQHWLTIQEKRFEIGDLSPWYIRDLRRWIEDRFIPFFGQTELHDIKGLHITKFYYEIAPGLKMKTRHNILGALHKLFTDAVKQEIIVTLPTFPPEFSKSKIPEPDWRWADVETQDKLLKCLDDDAVYFIYFLMTHGARPSEARALQHEDIDQKNLTVTFRRTFSDEIIKHTKNKKIRTIPVDDIWLEIYNARRNPEDLPTAFVFTHKGKPLTEYWARNKWRYARRQAQVQINLYSASRHSIATQAAVRGESIYLLQRFLGHTDARTTERYAHVNVTSLKALQRKDNVVNLTLTRKQS
ncbi:MAG: tyrosine-type recombinase/integrase [Desulfomonilaceae bacterium]